MNNSISDSTHEERLTESDKSIIFSPFRVMLLLGTSIFAIEIVTMLYLGRFNFLTRMTECILDSLLLTILLFPILYWYIIKPLTHLIADYRTSEQNLRAARNTLEQKVSERTQELNDAMLNLVKENINRCQAEFALTESEERFRQIFEQSEDAIVLISPDCDKILDVNPVAERLFGKKRQDLINDGVRELCEGGDMENLLGIIDKLRHGDKLNDLEHLSCRSPSNETRILSFRGKMISLQGENVLYTTFRDISRRVRLEEESREIQARLIHANRMTSLGMLVASVAHEINNPNNYILMNADLLKRSWPDIHKALHERFEKEGDFRIGQTTYSEAVQFLPEVYEGIAEGAHRISEIVDNLKNYGRDDRGGMVGLVDLNRVVRLSVSILNHHISRTTHRFSLDLCDDIPPVNGNVKQLEQVAINLITNALHSLPDKEHGIRVSTGVEDNGEFLFMRVEDEGGGIPPDIAPRIMEPFFTTRLDRGGTGLGLAICSNIAKDHDGTIEFESDPGRGTVFTVRLPRATRNLSELQGGEECNAGF